MQSIHTFSNCLTYSKCCVSCDIECREKHAVCQRDYRIPSCLSIPQVHDDLCMPVCVADMLEGK